MSLARLRGVDRERGQALAAVARDGEDLVLPASDRQHDASASDCHEQHGVCHGVCHDVRHGLRHGGA